ncbi:MAG: citrate synthase [Desulfovibrionaceae bacterium]
MKKDRSTPSPKAAPTGKRASAKGAGKAATAQQPASEPDPAAPQATAPAPAVATLSFNGVTCQLPIVTGAEGEAALDISQLRAQTGLITLDQGYGNTGASKSAITFVDGERGILRYRGYPIEELAERSTFIETAMLLIFGELPTARERAVFRDQLGDNELLHQDMLHHFEGFPPNGEPMSILSAVVNALGSFLPGSMGNAAPGSGDLGSDAAFRLTAAKLISKVRTIAAFSYRKSQGLPFVFPDPALRYCANFLHMMFSLPFRRYEPPLGAVRALDLFLLVHADHEQNCSCSTVRMVSSTQATLFASVSAGICALWGRLHGGANAEVIRMLQSIRDGGLSVKECIEKVKQKEFRLMGFGHRIYKRYDPRAVILKKAADNLFKHVGVQDDLFLIAQELEAAALSDDYFVERSLYPNVDFYSGLILKSLGIPTPMFPVMFAIGRLPGWIAHWREETENPATRIHRPRQIYVGHGVRSYVPMDLRDKS